MNIIERARAELARVSKDDRRADSRTIANLAAVFDLAEQLLAAAKAVNATWRMDAAREVEAILKLREALAAAKGEEVQG